MIENFKGLRKVVMVDVLEGNGKDVPFRTVHYVFDLDQHGGSHGGLVGVIDPYKDGYGLADKELSKDGFEKDK